MNCELITSHKDPTSQLLKLFVYSQLASNVIMTQGLRVLRLEMQEGVNLLSKIWKETREIVRIESEITRREIDLHSQRIMQKIENIGQIHQQTVNILNFQINEQIKKLEETRHRLEENEQIVVLQGHEIRNLRTHFLQKQHEIMHLNQKHKKKKFLGIF